MTSFPNVSRFVGHRLMLEPRPQLIGLIFVEMVHTHTHCQGIDRNSDAKKPWRLPISIPALLHPDKLPTPEHVLGLLEIPQSKDHTENTSRKGKSKQFAMRHTKSLRSSTAKQSTQTQIDACAGLCFKKRGSDNHAQMTVVYCSM